MTTFRGTGGDDTIDRSADTAGDNFMLFQGGSDTVTGGSGDDIFRMEAALDAGDKLDGGAGKDTVLLNGDYSAGLVLNADTITNIEVMQFAAGHSYNITTNNGNVAAGEKLLVKGGSLGAGDTLTFDGAAEHDGRFYIIAGAGSDTLTGGTRNDVFDLSHGGNDTAHGGRGDDTFYMGGALGSGDAIDGGAGNDTLELNATYSNYALGNSPLTSIETLKLDAGHDYSLISASNTVGAGDTMTVDGSALSGGNVFGFSGNAETGGNFDFIVGHSSIVEFSGGDGNDIFDFTAPGISAFVDLNGEAGDDTVLVGACFNHLSTGDFNGGTGDDTLEFNGDYSSVIIGTSEESFETIRFDGGHSYGNVSFLNETDLPSLVTIDASQVSTLFNFSFSQVTAFTVEVGSGGMDATPTDSGTFNDTFIVTSESALAASSLDGGSGTDTLELNGDFSTLFTLSAPNVQNFEIVALDAGHSYNLAVSDGITGGSTLTVDASAATSLSFSGSSATTNFDITGSAGSDTIIGGFGNSTITGGGGADLLTGGPGHDTFVYAAAADSAADTKVHADTIGSFDASLDNFDLPFAVTYEGVHTVASADDFSDLGSTANSFFSASQNDAVVLNVTSGALAGHTILLVDFNADGTYSGASDLAIDITGYTGTITSGDFI